SILAMGVLVVLFRSIHRHYSAVGGQLRQSAVRSHVARNDLVLLVPSLDAATVDALGYVRSIHPSTLRAVCPEDRFDEIKPSWNAMSGGSVPLDALGGGDLLGGLRTY